MDKNIFVTAIGTDSGKTVVSSILCSALQYDYWKPVQCGKPTDTESVMGLSENSEFKGFPEKYLLNLPASPHIAAESENVSINLDEFVVPKNNKLLIEGAGGIAVPLNDTNVVIDIATKLNLSVILVSNFYLGSINHTLLSIESLKVKGIEVLGIVFNGSDPQNTKPIILQKSGLKELLHIEQEQIINTEVIKKYVTQFRENNPEFII